MESIKKENEKILRALEELNQILIEIFHTKEKGKRADSEDISYQHKYKKTKQIKNESISSSEYMVINVTIIILVIVVRITTILGKGNINLLKKSMGILIRSSHQHLMEKLKRGRKQNPGYPG